ncbi:ABC transporter ATP-binding protein [Dictyoglomus thermophilum]|uniref:Oligopeptide ABC transporter, ATP-binding protein n=1 Tax=Dictyoglomus thermophilum (strain ATCC 35947 / DSM 3960 / H-6-12) TaxID=309799 RepID=B5YC63_DICT6|nr:ABC transporter ATP-binding protein [Dictyoglomus thermophilum]ACI19035.1 oligopeptide ABC transporter, ATP-binding protein [Dictyoglomus thermophilum H-6-12]
MRQEDFLIVRNLKKVFSVGSLLLKTNIYAVNNVSFEIDLTRPEIFTLAGESGSGKSTLARMLLGLIKPTFGEILYKGRDITKLSSQKDWYNFSKEVQPIFQNPFETFNPLVKVETYLYDTALNYKVVSSLNSHDYIEEILITVGLTLEEIKNRYPHEFSGGQLQRLSIARALITRPTLLIADEPVSMIDASLRMSIVNLFKELKEKFNVTVIYITHDLATAYYISDRIAIMLRGNIVELGPVERVLLNPLHPYTKLLKSSIPEPTAELSWDEEVKLTVLEEKEFGLGGCKFAYRCTEASDICFEREPIESFVDERIVKCHMYSSHKFI